MPIDRESKRELIKRQVKARRDEHDAELSDEKRLRARHKADFYEMIRKKLDNQSTDSNQ